MLIEISGDNSSGNKRGDRVPSLSTTSGLEDGVLMEHGLGLKALEMLFEVANVVLIEVTLELNRKVPGML